LRTLPPDAAASLIDASARGYRKLLLDSHLEKSAELATRLDRLEEVYADRPNGVNGHADKLGPMFADLRNAIAKQRLGPVARKQAESLVTTADLEQGRWGGRVVDRALIDGLSDEMLAHRFSLRLPSPELREQARRRVIRIKIGYSQFPEVHEHAAAVEEIVLKLGAYRISLTEHPPVRGWLDKRRVPMRGVLVRQHVWNQTATLLGYTGDRPGVSVLPELSLRDALMVQVRGISLPITLCRPPERLDPTPCIAPADVKLENAAAYLDAGGSFHFVDQLTMREAVALAQEESGLVLPVTVGGRPLLSFEWALYYERPENLVFPGGSAGERGPDISVGVDHRERDRFFFTVWAPGRSYLAVVEARDIASFFVVSQGAAGFTGHAGTAGTNGTSGSSGTSASCPSTPGGNGGNGGDGGDGGPGGTGGRGGDGGDVRVELACADETCSDAKETLGRIVLSEAGAGGAGGRGGAGGTGGSAGSAGSGTSCTDSNGNSVSVPGGSPGQRGRDGNRGSDGSAGSPGRPGHVRFGVVK
jgi:hypothetical protein